VPTICVLSNNPDNLKASIPSVSGEGIKILIAYSGKNLRREWDNRLPSYPGSADVRYYSQYSPFGFAREMNKLIRHSAPSDVILLNDDAILKTPGGFSVLSRLAWENPEYGVLSAAVTGVVKRDQNPHHVHEDDVEGEPFLNKQQPCEMCEEGFPPISLPFVRDSKDRALSFICVYIRREIMERVGLLDERFKPGTYGFDDNDYCERVQQAGWKLGIVDSVVVEHNVSLPSSFQSLNNRDISTGLSVFRYIWGDEITKLHWAKFQSPTTNHL